MCDILLYSVALLIIAYIKVRPAPVVCCRIFLDLWNSERSSPGISDA